MRSKAVSATTEQLQKSMRAKDYVPTRQKKAPKIMPKLFVGNTVTEIRPMTKGELDAEGWELSKYWSQPLAIVLSNGTRIYASRDSEGNGPGEFFGRTKEGDGLYVARES